MRSTDIRRTFLDFFAARDHRVWPSSSLIPNDPTLLLTVAGMVQFKPYFLGEATPRHPRAASVQKCARTVDIENVGMTTRHLTFFEMLGNFSFGDYFKREAISWAWEISVSPPPQGFGFDPERIWATVYTQDDEAEQLWLSETDIAPDRVQRRGKEDNFWSTGAAGPCGPCSELYYDRGRDHGRDGGPVVDESRFMEYWNLVFMQFERDDAGGLLGELPRQNVDTGMGLERMAVLLQDVPNVYETDVLRPILERAAEVTGVAYEGGGTADRHPRDVSLRVIAEHARCAGFLIADGVLPSNEARGYVLRRLLRRAVRHARILGQERPIMPAMMESVIATLGDAWPELREQAELISRVARAEEEGFARTLRTGLSMLDQAIAHAKQQGAAELPGDTAFALHDTYGFPVDLTLEIAAEHGLELDRDAFAEHMEAQRARARAAGAGGGERRGPDLDTYRLAAGTVGPVRFVGYTDEAADTRLGALLTTSGLVEHAEEGDELEVVLPTTPFYAEGGGQLGDHGIITTDTGRIEVLDTLAPVDGLVVHRARVAAGEVHTGQDAHAEIDRARRASIRRGHTATHILHATLKDVVGDHAAQAGSAIDAGRFRFDFPHFEAVTRDQVAELEERVNTRIAADPEVRTVETSQEEARRLGAIALFGEKYGEHVRVVEIGDFSRELCGGTHVGHAAEVGMFTVLSEGSIAANLRRIEAVTGPEAFAYLSRERLIADEVARMLKVSTDELPGRVADLLERLRATEKEMARVRRQALMASAGSLLERAERVDGAQVLAATVEGADRDSLKLLATDLRNRMASGVVVLGSATPDGNAQLFAAVTPDLAGRLAARDVLAAGARAVGGGAGGKGDTAQAGGRHGARLAEAIEASRRAAREALQR
ncbi:MAG TPA: alanine--tRNA ligase [Egibacteraceae bacterium]|jgi:alanyl-tRNA synthetase|nr:alanine--tRNA ligase [Egibacteraceae bacterium]